MCTSKELLLSFLSSKARDWSLIWRVPARESKREVLPQPLTLLRLHKCDQEPRDYLATTIVATWDLSISPTRNSPALSPVCIKRPGSSSSRRHPPREQTPPWEQTPPPQGSRLQHTVNERPVRILLECILLEIYFLATWVRYCDTVLSNDFCIGGNHLYHIWVFIL